MKKEEYFDVRNLVWEVLIKTGADSLPIKIAPICEVMGARVIRYKAGQQRLEKMRLWHLTKIQTALHADMIMNIMFFMMMVCWKLGNGLQYAMSLDISL